MKRFLAIFSSAAAFLFTFSAAGKSKIRLIRQKKTSTFYFFSPGNPEHSSPGNAAKCGACSVGRI